VEDPSPDIDSILEYDGSDWIPVNGRHTSPRRSKTEDSPWPFFAFAVPFIGIFLVIIVVGTCFYLNEASIRPRDTLVDELEWV
jgi:hypothetical protein